MFIYKQVHDIAHLKPIRLVDQVSEHEPVRRYELLLNPEGSTFSKGYGKLESSSQPMRASQPTESGAHVLPCLKDLGHSISRLNPSEDASRNCIDRPIPQSPPNYNANKHKSAFEPMEGPDLKLRLTLNMLRKSTDNG